jgi:L-seryl-tRNA(Ser) seleniumtransferase
VGTTNRTSVLDYREAINERTRLLLRVHPSNFRIEGFTARPEMRELAALARERSLPLYEDLGSGCLVDLKPFGIEEPLAGDSFRDGADLVSFSGDKLLGGPQAGILAGKPDLVARLRRNPMFRALRLDKVIYQSLETTLRHLVLEQYDRIPALRMLRTSAEVIRGRAAALLARLKPSGPEWLVELRAGHSVAGGGSTPLQTLDTWLIAIRVPNVVVFECELRRHVPPVVARIEEDTLLLDLRTVLEDEEEELISALDYARSR